MSTDIKTPPAATFRLGSLKCTIWSNAGSNNRTYYSANIIRSYRIPVEKREEEDDDGWRESGSMREEDLIVMQELGRRAAEWIRWQIAANVEAADAGTTEF